MEQDHRAPPARRLGGESEFTKKLVLVSFLVCVCWAGGGALTATAICQYIATVVSRITVGIWSSVRMYLSLELDWILHLVQLG